MLILSEARELPAPPVFFGVVAFAILSLLLYLTLRIDKDH
ncbi:unannotated protein [freshwater metagenome]|jgi:hypothetical protein|uniref:Unannotated protein n=1 Tax=freshwater metagenome TaxID=449393 RepID=A0A6J6CGD7_9ZZZZ